MTGLKSHAMVFYSFRIAVDSSNHTQLINPIQFKNSGSFTE